MLRILAHRLVGLSGAILATCLMQSCKANKQSAGFNGSDGAPEGIESQSKDLLLSSPAPKHPPLLPATTSPELQAPAVKRPPQGWLDVTTGDRANIPSTCSQKLYGCSFKQISRALSFTPRLSNIDGLDWERAVWFCGSIDYNNKINWRLPTKAELVAAHKDGLKTLPFPQINWNKGNYWSTSTETLGASSAWSLDMATGNSRSSQKAMTAAVLCVHD